MKKKTGVNLSPLKLELDGKGISKNKELSPSGLSRFFVTLKNSFNKILGVNMLMVLGNLPLLFLVAVLAGYTRVTAYLPSGDLFQNFNGIFMIEDPSPFTMSFFAIEGLPKPIMVNTTLSYIFIGISALTLLTFGVVNVGCAYVLRNIAMGEAVFVWTDFKYAIKRNYKQAIPFGIIDVIINGVLLFNVFTTISSPNFVTSLMFWATVCLVVLYFFMRPYIYVQMVTFALPVFKMFKNALLFSMLGLKRNIAALLGNLILILLEILFIFGAGGILISIGVALPLAIMFGVMAYMKVFAAYFKIKEIMIDPYKQEHPDEFAEEPEQDDIIMHDDVTEAEKLDEIKKRNGVI